MPASLTITDPDPPAPPPGFAPTGFSVGHPRRPYWAFALGDLQRAVEEWVSLGTTPCRLYATAVRPGTGEPMHVVEWTGVAWAFRKKRA